MSMGAICCHGNQSSYLTEVQWDISVHPFARRKVDSSWTAHLRLVAQSEESPNVLTTPNSRFVSANNSFLSRFNNLILCLAMGAGEGGTMAFKYALRY